MACTSPFDNLLDTNYIPSTEELRDIRALLVDPETELRNLEEEISRLQARHNEVNRFIHRHRTLLSPFRRLPRDLWGDIFVQCLPDERPPARSIAEAPLLLTYVCRLWRDIALHTPRLWSALHVYISHSVFPTRNEDLVSRTEGVERWLSRSGSLPLTISLASSDNVLSWEGYSGWISPTEEQSFNDLRASFTEMILRRSSRLKCLTLNGVPTGLHALLERQEHGVFPLLEEVTLDPIPNLTIPYPFVTILQRSPGLQALRANVFYIGDLYQFKTVSHPINLTTLTLSITNPIDGHSLIDTLSSMFPLLVELSITYKGLTLPGGTTNISTPKKWLHLRRFDLIGQVSCSYSKIRHLFRSIYAPSLTHLRIETTTNSESQPSSDSDGLLFHDMVTLSSCNLVDLGVSVDFGSGFVTTLSQLECLTSLSVVVWSRTVSPVRHPCAKLLALYYDTDISGADDPDLRPVQTQLNPIIKALTSPIPSDRLQRWTETGDGKDGLLCPRLEHIRLSSCEIEDREKLLDFARARAKLSGTLKSLVVNFEGVMAETVEGVKSAAEAAREEGRVDTGGVRVEWEFSRVRYKSETGLREDPWAGVEEVPPRPLKVFV
ncbi:hypothetical protein PQX77_009204 [Marasmius sp. AFHP31]|nr:hypothetical protein PQX77_009204 [Marasmius sp. AFHP31]